MISEALKKYPLPKTDLSVLANLVENLLFCHALMVASEPLLELVLLREMPESLRAFYVHHLEDERGHAGWLEKDLASLGVAPRLNWKAAQIAGTQYYLVRHAQPEVLLGYMAALECRPMRMEDVERLESIHGKDALRTLRYHAEHDVKHSEELLCMIEGSEYKKEIRYNTELTASMLQWALD